MAICCEIYDEHKFEPRYEDDDEFRKMALDKASKWLDSEDASCFFDKITDASGGTVKKYIYDICIRCGKTIVNSNSKMKTAKLNVNKILEIDVSKPTDDTFFLSYDAKTDKEYELLDYTFIGIDGNTDNPEVHVWVKAEK